jgi:hypothetical protein
LSYYTQKVGEHVSEYVGNRAKREREGICERLNREVKKRDRKHGCMLCGEFLSQKPRTR